MITATLQSNATLQAALTVEASLSASLLGGSRILANETFTCELVDAQAINPRTVLVRIYPPPNLAFTQIKDSSNWSIPGLTIAQVLPSDDPEVVRLITSEHDFQNYTISLSASTTTANFTGYSASPRFTARVQGRTTIHVVFMQPMLAGGALSSPSSYALRKHDGTSITVLSVAPNHVSNPTRVVLHTEPLQVGHDYTLSFSGLQTPDGKTLQQNSTHLRWASDLRRVSVPLSRFTGEVRAGKKDHVYLTETLTLEESLSVVLDPNRVRPQPPSGFEEKLLLQENLLVTTSNGGSSHVVVATESWTSEVTLTSSKHVDTRSTVEVSLSENLTLKEDLRVFPEVSLPGVDPSIADLFGNPNGMVFFSPALKPGGAPSSVIQVDSVRTCTPVEDHYVFPKTSYGVALYTHGLNVVSMPSPGVLNSALLFGKFNQLQEVKFGLTDTMSDSFRPMLDAGAAVTMTEVYPPTSTSLLNNPSWALMDPDGQSTYLFRTFDNISVLPPPNVQFSYTIGPGGLVGQSLASGSLSLGVTAMGQATNIATAEGTFSVGVGPSAIGGGSVSPSGTFDGLAMTFTATADP